VGIGGASPRAHGILVGLVALVGFWLGGCAVPDDDQPRALDPSGVPFSLLATSTTTTTEPQEANVAQVQVPVYLVDDDADQLVEVLRTVPAPGSIQVALTQLLSGPTAAELSSGLTSAISRSTALLGVDGPQSGVVTVNLSDDVRSIGGEGQRLALAQVVFTVTAVPGVTGVLFAFEGEPSQVPDGQGQSTAEPLDRADFATFASPAL
jgi:spore germination protein GerM